MKKNSNEIKFPDVDRAKMEQIAVTLERMSDRQREIAQAFLFGLVAVNETTSLNKPR